METLHGILVGIGASTVAIWFGIGVAIVVNKYMENK
jgi:hypothetical protein